MVHNKKKIVSERNKINLKLEHHDTAYLTQTVKYLLCFFILFASRITYFGTEES